MFNHTSPQPQISEHGTQEFVTSLSGGSGSVSSPQGPNTWYYSSNPWNALRGHFQAAHEFPPNLAPNDDQNDAAEVGFSTQHRRSPHTSPSHPNTFWDPPNQAQIQSSHSPQKYQIPPAGRSLLIQDAADFTNYAGGGGATSSGQSSPFPLGSYYPRGVAYPLQPFHVASRSIGCYPYRSTPGSTPDTNWNIDQDTRYRMENYPTGSPSVAPPTLLPAGAYSVNFNSENPSTHPNHQPLNNPLQSPQPNKQSAIQQICPECDVSFTRPGDLHKHLTTAKAHGAAKGPYCPVEDCKYHERRFTREDNLKAHLVNIHKIGKGEAAKHIQEWKDGGRK